MQTENDVIAISPLWGVERNLCKWNQKEIIDFIVVFNRHVLFILNGLEVIQHFLFAWDFPTGGEILGVFGENNPQKWKY